MHKKDKQTRNYAVSKQPSFNLKKKKKKKKKKKYYDCDKITPRFFLQTFRWVFK